MKNIKYFTIGIITVISAYSTHAQDYMQLNTYQDTANYLIHEIQMKKNNYIGKPFSLLLNDLKIKPKNIIIGNWMGGTHGKEKFGISFTLDFNYEREFEKSHFISVDFDNVPIDFNTLYSLYFPSEKRDINKIFDLYRNVIVKRVGVKLYMQDEPPRPGITDNSNL